jgi:DNA-binding NtrC family response regulator
MIKTVLIVDDEGVLLELIAGFLTKAGYRTITAGNGAEALQISRDYKGAIHLLLSDIQMPGMTGVELSTVMVHERPGIRVLLMSGFTQGEIFQGDWHFIAKPFLPALLCKVVAVALSTPRDGKSPPGAGGENPENGAPP